MGAILKFAVTATVSGIELATVGTTLIVVGIIGLHVWMLWMARPATVAVRSSRASHMSDVKRATPLFAGIALAFIPAAAGAAPKNPAPSITLNASSTTVVYSAATTLSGRISGHGADGAAVRVQQDDTRPYGDAYKDSSSATTSSANGKYSVSVKPSVNTQYRVVAASSPPLTSSPGLVLVRMLVGVRVADTTPLRGSRVRFAGAVFPAHDGRLVRIQRRSPSGRFNTVATTTLRAAGTAKSTYSMRARINRDGVYRVKVAGDDDHINGFSRLKTLTVHG